MCRYLKTFKNINGKNQKIILEVDKCNRCPLLKFNEDNFIATCRVFESTQGNVLDDFVINYNIDTKEIYDDIDIPFWCLLSNSLQGLNFDTKSYTLLNDKLLINKSDFDIDLPVYNALEILNNTQDNLFENILPLIISASVHRNIHDEDFSNIEDIDFDELNNIEDNEEIINGYYNSNTNSFTKNLTNVCSLCGENNELVNRDINNGMCDKCFDISKSDKKLLNKAYINNFRLKRGVDITDDIKFLKN